VLLGALWGGGKKKSLPVFPTQEKESDVLTKKLDTELLTGLRGLSPEKRQGDQGAGPENEND